MIYSFLVKTYKEVNKMFWDNFERLCHEQNKSPNAVATELGISSGSLTAWKNGRVPRGVTLEKLEKYFNVTKAMLFSDNQKEKPIENDGLEENTILLALRDGGVKKRKLTSEQMELIEKMIEQMPQADDDL